MPRRALISLVILSLVGCPAPGGVSPVGSPKPGGTPRPLTSQKPGATPTPAIVASGEPVALPGGGVVSAPGLAALLANARPVPAGAESISFTGKVKLLSDKGGVIISNNTGSLIANNGGGLVANNGGGLVANNGGALVANNSAGLAGKASYAVAQAASALAESPLADARVLVADAEGRVLLDAAGKPVEAVTDAQGGYAITGALPAGNLVLLVPLWDGGTLRAILPRGAREVPVDTASTLGATYVLERFVAGNPDRQAILDKLPASEATRLREDLAAARALIAEVPRYEPAALVALTEGLRGQAQALDKTLTDIKALLLGQARLGAGRQATEVPLGAPQKALRLASGGIVIAEDTLGRVRHVDAGGAISTWYDVLAGEKGKASFFGLLDMALAPDGSIYVVHGFARRVRRLMPDGAVIDVAGTGNAGTAGEGGPATSAQLAPESLCLEADGSLLVGEYISTDAVPRVVRIAKDGTLTALPRGPEDGWLKRGIRGLARTKDGVLWALLRHPSQTDGLYALDPGATAWRLVDGDLQLARPSSLLAMPDGGLLLAEDTQGRIWRYGPGGTARAVFAGKGGPAGTAGLVSPAGLSLDGDGLLVTDPGAAVVWRLAKDQLTVVAGMRQTGAGLVGGAIAINEPTGVAAAGDRLLIAEGGSHTLKAWDGRALTTVAGSTAGFAGDGGPAASAQLTSPKGVAADGGTTWLVDSDNGRIRKIAPDGTITSEAGKGVGLQILDGTPVPGNAYDIAKGQAMAIGPDKRPYWCSPRIHQVHRLRADGQVELVAGVGSRAFKGGDGPDGPAREAGLNGPLALAFGPDGALYVADSANARIRRVTGLGAGETPTMETWAGKDPLQTFAGLAAAADDGTGMRQDVGLFVPVSLAVDSAGNLYVGEIGTVYLPMFAGFTESDTALLGMVASLPPVAPRVRRIAPDGQVTVVVGPGGRYFPDPKADDALVLPLGLAVDAQNRLVVMDAGANLIRFCPLGP